MAGAAPHSGLSLFLHGRTAISALQEYCMKHKVEPPAYEELSSVGPTHQPIFVTRVTSGKDSEEGSGPTKKMAKQNSARRLLCKILGLKDDVEASIDTPDRKPHKPSPGAEQTIQAVEEEATVNTVGELQEFCQKKSLKPPIYEYVGEQGPPHMRQFLCTCQVMKLHETAVGKTKKHAKRNAAAKILNSIRQTGLDQSEAVVEDDEEDISLSLSTQLSLKTPNIPVLTDEAGKEAQEFYQRLRDQGPTVLKGDNYKTMLAQYSKEKKFEVTYLELKEKSYSGQYQCLLQVGSQPITVFHGRGNTLDDAHMDAAYHTLQYFKLMAWG